ncbi:hypothetical protein HG535_0A06470 [Zygotorulaspora mrakii]|uniref:Tubulin-specific chaperone A n=1 Tax=Zygotorulaspora mrakii TaxID=42260 RepID=A0A7H9AWI1_ZYGMR|nr:uncharacterized protein HG535_0A06470 [Zygotorulaspora mrakii]QLG70705.1 hypothetical protein HG535_0A06470 [Zygotorulaspora mrakii]
MAPTQLEIKVRALQRLIKEECYYKQEIKEQEKHVENLKNDKNVDPYDLKKQEEVRDDTVKLLPTMYRKIEEFKNNLEEFLETYEGGDELDDAKATIGEADQLLKDNRL